MCRVARPTLATSTVARRLLEAVQVPAAARPPQAEDREEEERHRQKERRFQRGPGRGQPGEQRDQHRRAAGRAAVEREVERQAEHRGAGGADQQPVAQVRMELGPRPQRFRGSDQAVGLPLVRVAPPGADRDHRRKQRHHQHRIGVVRQLGGGAGAGERPVGDMGERPGERHQAHREHRLPAQRRRAFEEHRGAQREARQAEERGEARQLGAQPFRPARDALARLRVGGKARAGEHAHAVPDRAAPGRGRDEIERDVEVARARGAAQERAAGDQVGEDLARLRHPGGEHHAHSEREQRVDVEPRVAHRLDEARAERVEEARHGSLLPANILVRASGTGPAIVAPIVRTAMH
jgi:hypothetical protein